jgi:Holliday junction resolvase RusA-like endonuclease
MAWQREVRAAASAAWPAQQPPYTIAVELRITHYAEKPNADVDNLIKPIQDALQGIAYVNDRVVKDVTGNSGESLENIKPHLAGLPGDNPGPTRRPFGGP